MRRKSWTARMLTSSYPGHDAMIAEDGSSSEVLRVTHNGQASKVFDTEGGTGNARSQMLKKGRR